VGQRERPRPVGERAGPGEAGGQRFDARAGAGGLVTREVVVALAGEFKDVHARGGVCERKRVPVARAPGARRPDPVEPTGPTPGHDGRLGLPTPTSTAVRHEARPLALATCQSFTPTFINSKYVV